MLGARFKLILNQSGLSKLNKQKSNEVFKWKQTISKILANKIAYVMGTLSS